VIAAFLKYFALASTGIGFNSLNIIKSTSAPALVRQKLILEIRPTFPLKLNKQNSLI